LPESPDGCLSIGQAYDLRADGCSPRKPFKQYADHLAVAKGLKQIAIMPIDENLGDEDLVDVNARLLPYVVVGDHKATI
jgi:hypothetical protein